MLPMHRQLLLHVSICSKGGAKSKARQVQLFDDMLKMSRVSLSDVVYDLTTVSCLVILISKLDTCMPAPPAPSQPADPILKLSSLIRVQIAANNDRGLRSSRRACLIVWPQMVAQAGNDLHAIRGQENAPCPKECP